MRLDKRFKLVAAFSTEKNIEFTTLSLLKSIYFISLKLHLVKSYKV
jgi:hypothetical protein